jgi:hypothetical protein
MIRSHVASLQELASECIVQAGRDPAQYRKLTRSAILDRATLAAHMLKESTTWSAIFPGLNVQISARPRARMLSTRCIRRSSSLPSSIDRFQVIAEHDADDFVFDPTFFGIERSADVVFVQLTLAEGRTLEQKRGFYKQVVDELNQRLNMRREDVFISLVGTRPR